ncbi:MAG: type 1 glutamine amidotransferase [Phycisphaerales bacterium]|nr:type 1 glutamine amidotransferase [Phycisphaerales bacterium]
MPLVVFQHWDTGRSGRLGVTLRDHGFKFRLIRPDRGEAIPSDYDDVDGVISLGGPQNVDDKHLWIQREMDYLKGAHDRQLPVLGVCLGHQLLAKALGGDVQKMEKPEMGFVDVDLTAAGQTDTMLSGIAWTSPQFQSHFYGVTALPPGATLLATSRTCKVQAFRAGLRSYGFQYHFEADRQMIIEMSSDAATDMHRGGVTKADLFKQTEAHYEMFGRLADRLCLNIATYLIPRTATVMRV